MDCTLVYLINVCLWMILNQFPVVPSANPQFTQPSQIETEFCDTGTVTKTKPTFFKNIHFK